MSSDKKIRILQTALVLFTEHGFQGTPTSMIAKRAGVATGTLFHHFTTKEDLINHLYLWIKDDLTNSLIDGVHDSLPLRDKLELIFANGVLWGIRNADSFLFFRQFSSSPYITQMTRDEGIRRFSFLLDIIADGRGQGMLKEMPQPLMINMCYSIMESTVLYCISEEGVACDDTFLHMAFDSLWDCICR